MKYQSEEIYDGDKLSPSLALALVLGLGAMFWLAFVLLFLYFVKH